LARLANWLGRRSNAVPDDFINRFAGRTEIKVIVRLGRHGTRFPQVIQTLTNEIAATSAEKTLWTFNWTRGSHRTNSFGSLTTLAAIRRASSRVSSLAKDLQPASSYLQLTLTAYIKLLGTDDPDTIADAVPLAKTKSFAASLWRVYIASAATAVATRDGFVSMQTCHSCRAAENRVNDRHRFVQRELFFEQLISRTEDFRSKFALTPACPS
jgi:hypothetical protein